MRKYLFALMALAMITSCQNSKPPVVLDSKINISVIIPDTTPADDVIYIAGPFTGGESFSMGNPAWKLQRSGVNCSIQLLPDTFIGNNTLADGFWFISEKHEVVRTLVGTEGSYVVAKWSR